MRTTDLTPDLSAAALRLERLRRKPVGRMVETGKARCAAPAAAQVEKPTRRRAEEVEVKRRADEQMAAHDRIPMGDRYLTRAMRRFAGYFAQFGRGAHAARCSRLIV